MKKIILILSLFYCLIAQSQIYTPINNYGQSHQRIKVGYNFKIPTSATFTRYTNDSSSGDVQMFIKGDTNYLMYHNGVKWKGLVDSFSTSNDSLFYFKFGIKTFYARVGLHNDTAYAKLNYVNTFTGINNFTNQSSFSNSSLIMLGNTGVGGAYWYYDDSASSSVTQLFLPHINSITGDTIPYKRWVRQYVSSNAGVGTVTTLTRTNGLGIIATVTNPTTTPNIDIKVDTADISIISRQRAAATYIDSIRVTNSGILHTSPAAFSKVGTTGVITQTLATQTANKVLASPNGSSGTPTFRSLVNADLPKRIDSTEKTLPSGLITFTGTTAPSGTTYNTYEWSQNGRVVTFRLNLSYSVAASGITTVVIAIPTDMPAPNLITDYQTTNDVMIPISCNGGNTRTIINPLSANINRNGGTPAIRMNCSAQNIQYLQIAGSYFTNN